MALPLHSLQGKCCRCRESCSACATRSSAAPGEKVPSSECARTDEGSEGGFLLTPGWSPQRPFPFFGAKRKIPPPPSPLREAAFPAFTASAPKAVHSTSVLSGSAAEGNEGAFRSQDSLAYSPDEAPSIPIGACPNGVTEGTSVAFMCGNLANAV